jgi:hypothetical protein
MEIKDRAISARESINRKRLENKLDDARQVNARLDAENRALHDESGRERGEIERLLAALEGLSAGTTSTTSTTQPKPKRHRLRRTMTLAVAAGGAYVMGAKAGRERFEQIKDWWQRTSSKGMRAKDDTIEEALS